MSNRTYQGPPIDMTYNHLSERAGKTVGGTTDDDKGEMKTDSWPESAPPKDELNEDQIAVVEAVADPTREWESMAELGREVVPHRSRTYASDFLRRNWPEGHERLSSDDNSDSNKNENVESGQGKRFVCDLCSRAFNSKTSYAGHRSHCNSEYNRDGSLSEQDVQEIRRRLLDGESTGELANTFGCVYNTVRRAAKGLKMSHIDEDEVELPPLVVVGKGPSAKYKLPDECEDADTATQAELTSTAAELGSKEKSKPQPQPESIASDSDTTDKRNNHLRTVALAILAFIFGWAINK